MSVKVVQMAWENYVAESLPKNLMWPEIRQHRKAFYAGATAIYSVLLVVEKARADEGQAILRLMALELKAYEDAAKKEATDGDRKP